VSSLLVDEAPDPRWFVAMTRPGVRAVQRMWRPIVLLQFVALIVVVGYFTTEIVSRPLDSLGSLKASLGWGYPAIASALAAGLLPEIAKFVAGVDRTLTAARLRFTLFNMGMFAFNGLTAEAFYRTLEATVGPGRDFGSVAMKVLLDMTIFAPLIGLMTIAVAYTWREERFSIPRVARQIGPRWYARRVGTMLIPCWAYWIPMTSLMYSLPASLTFVFGNLASAASAILLTTIAANTAPSHQILQGPRGLPVADPD
jgi:hypothetical protein